METEKFKPSAALNSADKWFSRIFVVGFVASLFGFADGLLNPVLENMVRQELNWFSELVFDFTGPKNIAAAFRNEDLLRFGVFCAIYWFIAALAISLMVFGIKKTQNHQPDN